MSVGTVAFTCSRQTVLMWFTSLVRRRRISDVRLIRLRCSAA